MCISEDQIDRENSVKIDDDDADTVDVGASRAVAGARL